MMDTIEKEKKCLSIAAKYVTPIEKPSIIKRIVERLTSDLSNDPVWLMLLLFPVFIFILPVTMYEVIKSYRDDKNAHANLVNNFELFKGFDEKKTIANLWDEYGLKPKEFFGKEEALASCLSQWVTILYENKYNISKNEILRKFQIEQNRQSETKASAYKNSGALISFVDCRVVVVNDILDSLPEYVERSKKKEDKHITQNQEYRSKRAFVDSMLSGNYQIKFGDEEELVQQLKDLVPQVSEVFGLFSDEEMKRIDSSEKNKPYTLTYVSSAVIAALYHLRFTRWDDGDIVTDDMSLFFDKVVELFLFNMSAVLVTVSRKLKLTEDNILKNKDLIDKFQTKLEEMTLYLASGIPDVNNALDLMLEDKNVLMEFQSKVGSLLIKNDTTNTSIEDTIRKLIDNIKRIQ